MSSALRFHIMKKTVDLLERYGETLSAETKDLFKSSPERWTNLKTKVSLAKQRLGPRIQVGPRRTHRPGQRR